MKQKKMQTGSGPFIPTEPAAEAPRGQLVPPDAAAPPEQRARHAAGIRKGEGYLNWKGAGGAGGGGRQKAAAAQSAALGQIARGGTRPPVVPPARVPPPPPVQRGPLPPPGVPPIIGTVPPMTPTFRRRDQFLGRGGR